MRINITGEDAGKEVEVQYDLFDEYDPVTDTFSMARTTGYACTGVADMILKGMISSTGVLAPEMVGREERNFEYLMHYLQERNVIYRVAVR